MSDRATTPNDNQALRTALQALAAQLGKTPTVVDMHTKGDYHPETYVDAYGSWDDALSAANLDPDDVTQKITDTQLLSELQRLATKLGRPPKKSELTDHSKYSARTYQNRFGSWNGALQEAMLDTHGVSDTELARELQRLNEELGRVPRPSDMSEHGSHGTVTYYRRFNTWDNALTEANLQPADSSNDPGEDSHEKTTDAFATDWPITAEPNVLVTPRDLARTYHSQSYEDAWQAVEDYQRVLDYTVDHPNKGSAAIASALDLPRSRIRPWVEDDVRPDPVRGIQTAEANCWLPIGTNDDQFSAFNVLVAWIFSGGSISDAYAPSFVIDRPGTRHRLTDALDELDISYDVIRETDSNRATEVRPTTGASVLGRLLTLLGAPQGEKNTDIELSLPSYLGYAPHGVQEAFVDVYLQNRGQTHPDKAMLSVREDRSQAYLEGLASLFQQVSGGSVSVSEKNVHLSADAARNLYGKFGPQWD